MKFMNKFILGLSAATVIFGKSINAEENSSVDENFVKNVINAENMVKLHYESGVSNEDLGKLLEEGWDYATNSYIINNNIKNSTEKVNEVKSSIGEIIIKELENADSKHSGSLAKRDSCPWYREVYCAPLKGAFYAVCVPHCGIDDKKCLKSFCRDQYNCYLDC